MVKRNNSYTKIALFFLLIFAFGFGSEGKVALSASPSDGGVYNGYEEPDEPFDYGFEDCDSCDDDDNNDEPDATTRSASSIGETSATLNAHVDGNGSSTKVWFEYGRSRSDLDKDTSKDSIGSGSESVNIRVTGLKRDTVYYFRVVARNDEGTDTGSVVSFRTDDDNNNDEVVINQNRVIYTPPPVNQYFFTTNTTAPKVTKQTETVTPAPLPPIQASAPEEEKKDEKKSGLVANVLGFAFFPTTLLGWMAFIIFVLILYILGRKYLYPAEHSHTAEVHDHH